MYTTNLLAFAKKHSWHTSKEEDLVHGIFNGRQFTAMSERKFTAFFTPLAGISPGGLARLTAWLEQSRRPLRIRNYELSDNFLCLRLHESFWRRSVSALETTLTELADVLSTYKVPETGCIVCGKEALQDHTLEGFYCKKHPDCDLSNMVNFTDLIDNTSNLDASALTTDIETINRLANSLIAYQEDMINDLVALCKIPSIEGEATDTAPFGEQTALALKAFEEIATRLGFSFTNVDNYFGYAEIGSGSEMVAAVCHLDVVPAGDGWTHDPFTPIVAGDEIIGRGTSDDKGPAIAVLYAAKALIDDGYMPDKRIRIIVGLNEERGSACMEHYCKVEEIPVAGFTADADFPVIYAEKGSIRLFVRGKRQCKGAYKLSSLNGGEALNIVPALASYVVAHDSCTETIEANGIPAHASKPEHGQNAISLAVSQINQLLQDNASDDDFINMYSALIGLETNGAALGISCSDETGALTLNVGLVNLDENCFELGLDLRVPVSVSLDDICNKLISAFGSYGYDCEIASKSIALNSGKDSKLVTTLTSVYNELTGQNVEPVAIGGGTYARSLPNIVAFGTAFPGDVECAHQANEFVSIPKLLAATAIYKEALKRLSTNE